MRIIESNSKIEKEINSIIAKQAFSVLKKRKEAIRTKIVNIVAKSLSTSPTLDELVNGKLKYDFGLEFNPVPDIIYAVSNSVSLGINPIGDKRFKKQSLVTLYVQPRTYNNLLSLAIAEQDIDRGETIPWLKWLLLEGDEIIIFDYEVEYGTGFGRSGGARMKKSNGFFKVNPAHSGTRDDNFITKAISAASDEIIAALQEGLR
jgi:hypothetical protein